MISLSHSPQAVLMMYNKSVQSFDHAISLSQDLDWVKRRRAAVLVRKLLNYIVSQSDLWCSSVTGN